VWLVLACLVAVVATNTTPALAAAPCGTSGVFSQLGSTATCTYTYTGSEQMFTTPQGVLSLEVEAVGAPGGSSRDVAGGAGGTAETTIRPAPSHLMVEVGGPGGDGTVGAGPGGFSGGGDGGSAAGGGGGASEVCAPVINAGCDHTVPGHQEFVVAAGGGGAGATNPPGAGAGGPAGMGGMLGADRTDAMGTVLLFGGGGVERARLTRAAPAAGAATAASRSRAAPTVGWGKTEASADKAATAALGQATRSAPPAAGVAAAG
jgi:Glycine rich protein